MTISHSIFYQKIKKWIFLKSTLLLFDSQNHTTNICVDNTGCKKKGGKIVYVGNLDQTSAYFGITPRHVGKVSADRMRGIQKVIIHENYDPKGYSFVKIPS